MTALGRANVFAADTSPATTVIANGDPDISRTAPPLSTPTMIEYLSPAS